MALQPLKSSDPGLKTLIKNNTDISTNVRTTLVGKTDSIIGNNSSHRRK